MSDRDPHCGRVPEAAWAADAAPRARGRVEILNATRPGGMDGWTMDLRQDEALRAHVLETMDALAGADGSVALQDVVVRGARSSACRAPARSAFADGGWG